MVEDESCQWSSLPSDLIHFISTKLPDLSDRVRLRAVCKTWRSSISISDPSPRLPWLLTRTYNMDGNEEILYYSLSSQKTYKIYCPHLKDASFRGTFGGFILFYRYPRSVFLFNPLTRLEISVSLSPPKYFDAIEVASNPFCKEFAVVLGCTQDSTCAISFGFIKPDDGLWVIHESGLANDWCDCVYYEGMYYINDYGADTRIMNATTGEVVSTIPSPETGFNKIECQYMLETCGEILLIYRHKIAGKMKQYVFDIYRLDEARGDYQWVKIRGIGDRMLFLNSTGGFSVSASDFPGFRGNCIYFQAADLPSHNYMLLRQHDLENGTTKILPNFWGECGTWIIPNFG
ncbi:hypothetical protein LUZ62_080888 [Rhynchospora pubera]|uniref:F-box domain-containing protein n=1 Tax=Rhynchospora pubera TaxID=906938 RepID=A0AAV8BX78_9POAL|nr:hypothetical protein LUZ62_080888 [Rhynchospora pubera]